MPGRYVALIPARGGSKGIRRKNLETVGGRSLLERAISSGQGSARISGCYVSSDDDEILAQATELGAQAHRRHLEAATDGARACQVVQDFLDRHDELQEDDGIAYLQPTSPFRTPEHVDEAIALSESFNFGAVVSVVASHQLPQKTLVVNTSGLLELGACGEDPGGNRQDFGSSVYPNGAIYLFSIASFRELGDIPVTGAAPLPMGKIASIDIDSLEDLDIARGVATNAGL